MPEKKTTRLFRFMKGLVRLLYPKIEVAGVENLPVSDGGNHADRLLTARA